ncbi:MAG: 1-acyl-sn-glycerol-3-phosphate acyltransferase, partial [Cyanobacteria bacterium P01_F01_bin.42]
RYEYIHPPWAEIEQLVEQLEADLKLSSSFEAAGLINDPKADRLYGRLLRIGVKFLDQVEAFYTRNFGKTFELSPESSQTSINSELVARLYQGLDQILRVSEDLFQLQPKGDFSDRCRRLEQASWARIFMDNIEQLSPIERGLADWQTKEASLKLNHMRMAERLICLTDDYIISKPTADRFAEVVLILWRISVWIKGENPHSPPQLGKRRATITVCDPIAIQDYWAQYKMDRRSAKKTVQVVTQTLKERYEAAINQ